MLALFVLGFFVLPSATIFLIASRMKPARAQAVRDPVVRSSARRRSIGLTLRNRPPTGG
jgi:hypothetical protein